MDGKPLAQCFKRIIEDNCGNKRFKLFAKSIVRQTLLEGINYLKPIGR